VPTYRKGLGKESLSQAKVNEFNDEFSQTLKVPADFSAVVNPLVPTYDNIFIVKQSE
jgi:hypothetical protein